MVSILIEGRGSELREIPKADVQAKLYDVESIWYNNGVFYTTEKPPVKTNGYKILAFINKRNKGPLPLQHGYYFAEGFPIGAINKSTCTLEGRLQTLDKYPIYKVEYNGRVYTLGDRVSSKWRRGEYFIVQEFVPLEDSVMLKSWTGNRPTVGDQSVLIQNTSPFTEG